MSSAPDDDLPTGFTIQSSSPATASAGASGTSVATGASASRGGASDDLPDGFALATDTPAPHSESVIPYAVDKFKQGFSNLAGLGGHALDALSGLEMNTKPMFKPGSREALERDDIAKRKAAAEPLGDMITRGWEGLLGVKKVAQPKNPQGGDSKANEYIGTISEFLGGSLIPGAGAVVSSERKLATAVVSALGTAASGAGAVEGKQVGSELAPGLGLSKERGAQIGEFAGSLTGPGLIGHTAQTLLKSGGLVKSAAASQDITGTSKDAQRAAANSLLAKDITNGLQHAPQSEANLARSLELSKRVPGWAPTIAQASGAPALVAMQKEVANKSGEALAKASAADARNLSAISAHRERSFPGSDQAATDPARIKIAANRAVTTLEADKAQRALRALTDKFRRTADNQAIGDELRSKYWDTRAVAKRATDAQLADVYSTARKYSITEDMTDVRDSVQKIVTADRQTFQDMPPAFHAILQKYEAPPKTQKYMTQLNEKDTSTQASFEELHSLYKQVNKDWADATAAGNLGKAHYMALIKDQLGTKVGKYSDARYGDLAQKFQDFNSNYAKYSQTFREGAGGEIAKRGRGGLTTDSEDIVSKVILQSSDKKKGVQDFFQMFGSDERAAELLHEGLLDNFSKVAVRNGSLDPKAAAGWLKRHETALGQLPELRTALTNTKDTAGALLNRQLLLQKQRAVLDRTVLAKIAKSDKPEELVQRAISDPKLMKGLLVGTITEDSKQAVARAIADSVAKRPDAYEFLAANKKTLKPALDKLGPGHWQNLKDISEMEQIAGRVKAPTAVELSKLQDIGEQTIGTSVKGMLSRLRNMDKPMGVSKEYMVLDVGGRWFYKTRSEELSRLREAAMFDPDTAKLLSTLAKQSGAPSKAQLLDLQRLSFNAGVNSTSQAVGGH